MDPKKGAPKVDEPVKGDVPKTKTTPFGGEKAKEVPKEDGKAALRAQAELAVKSQHGEHIDRNPNYEAMVKDAEKQISGAVEQNKDM
jgi:hypothetical protein